MRKQDEIENPNSTLNKAADDEPLFVLRANDLTAPDLVERWAALAAASGQCPLEKIQGALAAAKAMREWTGPKKMPD